MVHIARSATLVFLAGVSLGACSSSAMRATNDESMFPQGQCELKINAGSVAQGFISSCESAELDAESKALLTLARSSRIFYQRGMPRADLAHGIKLIEEVLALAATGQQIGQTGGGQLPAEANRFWVQPAYIFIATDGGPVKATFNTGSDAVVVSREDNGDIAADYVIY